MRNYFKRFLYGASVIGLFAFMLMIFIPAETLYANVNELPFVFGDYAKRLIGIAVISIVLISFVTAFLLDSVHKWLMAIIFAIDIAAYIQNMFLNKNLDLMGENPNGYNPPINKVVINTIIWSIILIVSLVSTAIDKKKRVILCLTLFVLAIQIVAYVSILVGADESFYNYPETEYHLSGEEQFVVSSEGNTILFVVDCLSDRDLGNALAVNPRAIDMLNDFTRYTNTDACYFGTFPSLTHMLTNDEVNFDLTVNEWTAEAWNGEKCKFFYDRMHDLGYRCNIYTPEISILCVGNKPEDLLRNKWDNLTNSPLNRLINNEAIQKGLVKMAAYRLMPDILKDYYYVTMCEYTDTVKVIDDPIMHENYDFYGKLLEGGLSVKDEGKMFIVQHIMGTHVFENDENGNYKEGAGYEETTLGCLNILRCYIDELKRLGVYDNSNIIITADHGWEYGQQPVFFIKEEYKESDNIEETDAPISHKELLPTIAEISGVESTIIGNTIYDYTSGQKRERTLYFRDHLDDYPDVPYYDGSKKGDSNVYVGYTYTGDEENLLEYLFDYPSVVVPMVDSYF